MPDITILDLNFLGVPRAIASYLIRGPEGHVLVETGPGSTRERQVAELARLGLAPTDIRAVLVTHIHLDHAGAAGWWAQQGVEVCVHPFGAPHLIDPSKLLASAQRIYGDQMDDLWGAFLAAPAERVHSLADGAQVTLAGVTLTAWETPGHARHHFVYQVEDVALVGDLGGMRMPGVGHIRLPTPPPEFELEAWQASLARMRALNLRRIYLTHFGAVDDVDEHWARTSALLEEYAAFARQCLADGLERDDAVARFKAWEAARLAADHIDLAQYPAYHHLGPVGMSCDGLLRYWKKKQG
jgi:glyoxylase-like metal-dependent hydrolase (beta-lactamase superfamily II)